MTAEGVASLHRPTEAKAYNRIKLSVGIAATVLSFALLAFFVFTGSSHQIEQWARSVSTSVYGVVILFAAAVGLAQSVLTLPLGFYSGFVIEHRFGLSNQSIGRWVWERIKGILVGAPLMVIVLCVLYYSLERYGRLWWLPVGIVMTLFSVILARIAPVVIMPLFYRFTPIQDGALKERILRLCSSAGLRVEGVFSFNLSKNTKKANAGFTGIGRSRRIILGDTLMEHFTEDEVETVFAHELGHYRYRHIAAGIATGTITTFLGLFLAARLYDVLLPVFGFGSVADVAALPLLAILISLYGLVTSPVVNMIARRHERQADRYAVQTTGNGAAFVSALQKLASMNLADPEPHPVVEFLFYSHPSVSRRIAAVEALAA